MSNCSICHIQFSWINRQHKCKNCLRAVCSGCGRYKRAIYSFDPTGTPHRCCIACVNDNKVDKLSQYYDSSQSSGSDEEDSSYDIHSILKDANTKSFVLWLSTFNKCWLRSKYPQHYIEKQQELLAMSAQPKLTKRKHRKMLRKTHDNIGRGYYFNMKHKQKNPIVIIDAGTLWINILNAVNIPDCDIISQFGGKPDCYITYFITNNDTLFLQNDRLKKHKTKVQKYTFCPSWNEQKTMIITNTTGRLVIELWENSIMSDNVLLGVLQIKLSNLFIHYLCSKENGNDIKIDDWFEITICEKLKSTKHISTSSMMDDDDANNEGTEGSPRVYEQIESIPVVDTDELKKENKCCIRLQLRLQSSWWAHFISHFDPVLPEPHKVEWNLDLAIHELNSLQWLFNLLSAFSDESKPILYWIEYQRTVIYLILFTVFVYYPWFCIFCIAFSALVYICHCYIATDDDKKQQLHLPVVLHWMCLLFGHIPTLREKILREHGRNHLNMRQSFMMFDESEYDVAADEEDNKLEEEEKDEISMSAFGSFAAQKAIKVTGLKQKIWWIQELLVVINDAVVPLRRVLNWHPDYIHITSLLCFGLFGLCIILVVFRETIMEITILQHVLYAVGVIILSFYSKPFQFMLWLVCGFSYWYFNFYRRYQLFSSGSVVNEMEPKRYRFVQRLWSQIGGVLRLILKILFFQTATDKERTPRRLLSMSKLLTKSTEERENDGKGKKVKMWRHQIEKQFTGAFDVKFQYILSRLKRTKVFLF